MGYFNSALRSVSHIGIGLALAALFLASGPASAATYTWRGTTDSLWSTTTNWNVNGLPGVADTTIFDGAGNGNTTIDLSGSSQSTLGITFTTSSAAGYTIGSGVANAQALTLASAGTISMASTVVNNQLFNAQLLLGDATTGAYTFQNDSLTNSLTFSGSIAGGAAGAAGLKTLLLAGSGNTTISGQIANGGASGIAVTKSGSGTLTLSGVNTYTGATTVNAGALVFSGTNTGLGSLAINGPTAKVAITGGSTTINSFYGDTYVIGGGTLEVTGGALTLQGGVSWFSVGNNNQGSGGGTLTLTSGEFTSTNGYGVTVANSTGTININGGTFTADGWANNGIILGEGASGQGTLNLNGGTLITDQIRGGFGNGTIYFNGGTLKATGDVATVLPNYANMTAYIQSGGLTVDGPSTTIDQALLDGGGNGGLAKTGAGALTLSGANTFTGNITVNSGSLVAANSGVGNGASGSLGNVNVARTITVNSGGGLSFTAGDVTGNAGVVPAATLVVNAGGSVFSSANDYNSLGPVTLAGGTITTLGGFSTGYGGFGLQSTVTVTANATTSVLASAAGATSLFNLLGSGTFDVADGAAAVDLLVSGNIGGATRVGLTKVGAGTMVLSGSNNYGAETSIAGGVLAITGTTNIGTNTTAVAPSGTAQMNVSGNYTTQNLNIGGATGAVGAIFQTGGTTTITAGASAFVMQIGQAVGAYGYYGMKGGLLSANEVGVGGAFSGAGTIGILDVGGGTVDVNGWLTTGRPDNQASVLNVTGSGTVISRGGDGLQSFGGTSVYNLTGSSTLRVSVAVVSALGAGDFNLAGGTFETNAGVTTAGRINLNGGTIKALANNTMIGMATGGATVYGGGVTIDTNGFNSTITPSLIAASGTGVSAVSITSVGSGYIAPPLVTFSGGGGTGATGFATIANGTISGLTIVNPGTGYTSAPTVTLSGGGGSGATFGAVTMAANATTGGLTKTGAGALTLSGANTFTGNITINSGSLVAANGGGGNGASGALGNVNVARTITVNSGGGLSFAAGDVTGNDGVVPAATLVVNAGGSVFSGANSYNSLGPVTLAGGTITTLGGYSTYYAGFGLQSTVTVTANATTSVLASAAGEKSLFNLLGSGTFDVADGAAAVDLLVSGNIGGATRVGLTKVGAGTMVLSGSNNYGTATTVSAGRLAVNGRLTGPAGVTVQSGGELGGSGVIAGSIGGDGLIGPGNSPGILTVNGQLAATPSTAFAFELSGMGAPIWGNASESMNDVLRLTATSPFTSSLALTNIVNVYFDVASLANGDTFQGGFFVDNPNSTTNLLNTGLGSSVFEYFVKGDGGGGFDYHGTKYYSFAQYAAMQLGITEVTQSVVNVGSAGFADGEVTTGQITQFVIVPEPATVTLVGAGLAVAALGLRRRKVATISVR